ncbi:MAG: hypothetical protein M3Q44_08040 [bacterium]|nr:hypothetical protein [bacterium]
METPRKMSEKVTSRHAVSAQEFRVVHDLSTIVWSLTGGLTASVREHIDPDGSRIIDTPDAARAFNSGNLDRSQSLFVYRTNFRRQEEHIFKQLCKLALQVNIKHSKDPDNCGFGLHKENDKVVISRLLSVVATGGFSRFHLSFFRGGLALYSEVGDELPSPIPWALREALQLQEIREVRMHYPRYRDIALTKGVGAQILTMAADQHSLDAIFSFYRRDQKNQEFLASLPGLQQYPSPNRPGDRERLQIIVEAMSYDGLGGIYRRASRESYQLVLSELASSRWVTPQELQQPCYDLVAVSDTVVPVVVLAKAPADDLGFDYNPLDHGGMFVTPRVAETYWRLQSTITGKPEDFFSRCTGSIIFK